MDAINLQYGLTPWYVTLAPNGGQQYNPLIQDTPAYGQDFIQAGVAVGANSGNSGGYGLPFAYDPLWRYQTVSTATGTNGYYIGDTFEARFASGIGFIRNDPSDRGLPSAHGLQRVTNFNRPFIINAGNTVPIMPISNQVPSIFVSQEDVVWVDAQGPNSLNFSPVLPDLDPTFADNKKQGYQAPAIDWRYSWMFTGYQVSSSGGATFEGNIVIFENRPFGIAAELNPPNPTGLAGGTYRVAGETVVEAIFGHSRNVQGGYGAGADRTVLLRWYSSETDPVVKPGDWIADVTYERNALTVYNPNTNSGRFLNVPGFPGATPPIGVVNPSNNFEWDNLPAQRCFWYQVQKVTPAIDDPYTNLTPPLRSMVVTVDRSLQARTILSGPGTPVVFNAALISPYVVNVIPQQFTVK
jgi:hypothetical protein